jgi:hypothetical protein
MYSVDKFIEEAARINKTQVSPSVIEEIVAVREDARSELLEEAVALPIHSTKILHPVLTADEIFDEIVEFLDSYPSADGSVGLKHFVVNYLGSQNYEINHSYAHINSLAAAGRIELFKRERNGIISTRIRLP